MTLKKVISSHNCRYFRCELKARSHFDMECFLLFTHHTHPQPNHVWLRKLRRQLHGMKSTIGDFMARREQSSIFSLEPLQTTKQPKKKKNILIGQIRSARNNPLTYFCPTHSCISRSVRLCVFNVNRRLRSSRSWTRFAASSPLLTPRSWSTYVFTPCFYGEANLWGFLRSQVGACSSDQSKQE